MSGRRSEAVTVAKVAGRIMVMVSTAAWQTAFADAAEMQLGA